MFLSVYIFILFFHLRHIICLLFIFIHIIHLFKFYYVIERYFQ